MCDRLLKFDLGLLAAALLAFSLTAARSSGRRDALSITASDCRRNGRPGIKRPRRSLPDPLPYLVSPPAVIPIDVGRQLFVDSFLIEETDLRRTFHPAEYYPGNPLLRPDQPWEGGGERPAAMPYSDGKKGR